MREQYLGRSGLWRSRNICEGRFLSPPHRKRGGLDAQLPLVFATPPFPARQLSKLCTRSAVHTLPISEPWHCWDWGTRQPRLLPSRSSLSAEASPEETARRPPSLRAVAESDGSCGSPEGRRQNRPEDEEKSSDMGVPS